jgi:general secretion pathway protein H
MTSLARPRRRDAGFTLVEILIVVVILALAVAGLTMGLGALGRTKLRSSCVKITAAARFAYHRAVTQGKTVRIVLDFEENTMGFEEAHGQVTLRDPEAESRLSDDDDEEEDDGAVDPWARAQASLDSAISASMGRSAFGPIQDEDGEPNERYAPRAFEGASLARLFTPHELEPRESGKGYIYFFPGGHTEHAVVQMENADQRVYSVEIRPLTGQSEIFPEAIEPEELTEEDLRDPG